MHGFRYMWITCLPLCWIVVVTYTAGLQKIFSPLPALGFLAAADALANGPQTAATAAQIFNNRLDAAVTAIFLILVTVILVDSMRGWSGLLAGWLSRRSPEAPFVQAGRGEEVRGDT